jgi:hypothetical protein
VPWTGPKRGRLFTSHQLTKSHWVRNPGSLQGRGRMSG